MFQLAAKPSYASALESTPILPTIPPAPTHLTAMFQHDTQLDITLAQKDHNNPVLACLKNNHPLIGIGEVLENAECWSEVKTYTNGHEDTNKFIPSICAVGYHWSSDIYDLGYCKQCN